MLCHRVLSFEADICVLPLLFTQAPSRQTVSPTLVFQVLPQFRLFAVSHARVALRFVNAFQLFPQSFPLPFGGSPQFSLFKETPFLTNQQAFLLGHSFFSRRTDVSSRAETSAPPFLPFAVQSLLIRCHFAQLFCATSSVGFFPCGFQPSFLCSIPFSIRGSVDALFYRFPRFCLWIPDEIFDRRSPPSALISGRVLDIRVLLRNPCHNFPRFPSISQLGPRCRRFFLSPFSVSSHPPLSDTPLGFRTVPPDFSSVWGGWPSSRLFFTNFPVEC